jgi:hypothetical protein
MDWLFDNFPIAGGAIFGLAPVLVAWICATVARRAALTAVGAPAAR